MRGCDYMDNRGDCFVKKRQTCEGGILFATDNTYECDFFGYEPCCEIFRELHKKVGTEQW